MIRNRNEMDPTDGHEPLDLANIGDVITLMATSLSEVEWNKNCDAVKDANDGKYPDGWFQLIILSGLLSKTRRENGW